MTDSLDISIAGNTVIITKYPVALLTKITSILSYTQNVYDRTSGAFSRVIQHCCAYEKDGAIKAPGNYAPNRIFTFTGYLDILEDFCATKGITLHKTYLLPDNSELYMPNWDRLPKDFQFRYKQKNVIRAISLERGGIIVAPPGWGKSVTIGIVASAFDKCKILITTYNKSIYTQIGQSVLECLAGRREEVALQRGGRPLHEGEIKKKRVVVCGSSSLKRIIAATTDFDLLIVDEIHQACAPATFELLAQFQKPRIFGFTATPKRSDGAHFRMRGLAGPVLMEITMSKAVTENMIVPVEVRWTPVVLKCNPLAGKNPLYAKHIGIWYNYTRNRLIAAIAKQHEKEQTLIMVETLKHAQALQKLLPHYTIMYGEKKMRQDLERAFKNGTLRHVISTMCWKQGVDFPQLQILIRADGQSSNIASVQIGGRVTRLADDKEMGVVYDFYDTWDPFFKQKADKRKAIYHKCGWNQASLNVQSLLQGKLEYAE
jgi:superfamily II DNA or RNA helicase